MSYAARLRQAYPFKAPTASVDHIVVGGGVIGLAVAAGLVNTAGRNRTTFLVERRAQLGQETTARNSEVIHSAIPSDLSSHSFAFVDEICCTSDVKRSASVIGERRRWGGTDLHHLSIPSSGVLMAQLVVATSNSQIPYLDHLQTLSVDPRLRRGTGIQSVTQNDSVIPAYFLSGEEAREMEPDLSPAVKGALIVTETGIVDSQGLVGSLEREVEEEGYLEEAGDFNVGVGVASRRKALGESRGEGVIVRGTRVVRVDPDEKGGWIVQLESGWSGKEGEKGEVDAVRAEVVVNAAGLGSASLTDGIVPESEQVLIHAVKGNYMSYKGPGVENISRLIYPCPSRNIDSLGTHLTIDLEGNVRFGPDVEPLGTASLSLTDPDHWQRHLQPSASRLESIGQAVQDYLPGINPALLQPDYSGVRPNIAPSSAGFSDFMIRHKEERKGLIELLGFNSPGLTSSLAVGEYVAGMVRRDIWRESKAIDRLAEGWE